MAFGPTIPGETSIDDASGLKVSGITLQRELNIVEAENIRKATVKYLVRRPSRRSAPFDYVWFLKLHREMFSEVWEWAGVTRKRDLNFGIPWQQVEPTLYQLVGDVKYWSDSTTIAIIDQSVMLHHRAVHIHPFLNGNGRWSRMLANIWLRQNRAPVISWPEDVSGTASPIRETYLDAIRAADNGDYEPLTKLHLQFSGEKA